MKPKTKKIWISILGSIGLVAFVSGIVWLTVNTEWMKYVYISLGLLIVTALIARIIYELLSEREE